MRYNIDELNQAIDCFQKGNSKPIDKLFQSAFNEGLASAECHRPYTVKLPNGVKIILESKKEFIDFMNVYLRVMEEEAQE